MPWAAVFVLAASPATALPLVSLDLDADRAGIQATRTVLPGDVFDALAVVTDVAPAEALVGFQLTLVFAAAQLEPLAAVAGDFLLAPVLEIPSLGSGSVSLLAASQAAGTASGGGVLARLTLEALAGGTTAVDFSTLILSAPLGVPVAHESAGGRIAVPEPARASGAASLALALSLARRRKRARQAALL